ncbi:MAG TPA: hypothetical protein DDW55_11440 [Gammaproteobacteria bacterium]|nr:hypothetical protein [Gammaproteobacteria bacterium]
MEQERRGITEQLPDDVYGRLNTDQILALKLVEEYGWSMKFMRRPFDQEPTYVLFNNTTQQYAVLDEDGTINRESGIKIRNVSPA